MFQNDIVVIGICSVGVEFVAAVSDKPLKCAKLGSNLRVNEASDGGSLVIACIPGGGPAGRIVNYCDDIELAALEFGQGTNDIKIPLFK